MMKVPEVDVDVSTIRLSHTLALLAGGLTELERCLGGAAALMKSLLDAACSEKGEEEGAPGRGHELWRGCR